MSRRWWTGGDLHGETYATREEALRNLGPAGLWAEVLPHENRPVDALREEGSWWAPVDVLAVDHEVILPGWMCDD